ncbi:MAG: ribonuclease PH [Firmicutes bacterium]|jgi:ribonuclease PH|nr:ribonuclease PH [Bacillota bacterium]MBR6503540.1 ribonuclease PH [Bacillota bacterium]
MRYDGRQNDEIRPVKITPDYLMHPAGSVLIEMGDTKVICTASVEEKTARHLTGTGQGWVTAEYGMLPGSTGSRKSRERNKVDGRSQEIQRLVGRALRSVVDMEAMGERSVWIDCDVIQADGGTRTASITGGYVALVLAFRKLVEEGILEKVPVTNYISAISVGIIDGEVRLDLPYEEDSRAGVDMNIVMNDAGEYVEIQGTAEDGAFTPEELRQMLAFAKKGCEELMKIQKEVLEA